MTNGNGWKTAAGFITIGLVLGGLIGANQVQLARTEEKMKSLMERMDRVRYDVELEAQRNQTQLSTRILDLTSLIQGLRTESINRLDKIESKVNR